MSASTTTTDEALAAARWDLEPLVDGGGAERALAQLDEAQELSDAFAGRYHGKVAELDAPGLAEAMRELETISDLAGRAGTYASLAFSVDTVSPEVGSLMQQIRERSAKLQTTLLFFDLEWNEVDDARAEELLAADEIAFCRHYLRTERRYRPHQLTEPEERILTEASVTGSGAFARLFTELTSAITVEVSGRRRAAAADGGAQPPAGPRPGAARRGRRRRHRGARARAAHAGVHLQHAASGQGHARPPALLRQLARRPQPRQRGRRRVGRGADRGRGRALRARPALVPAQGADARARAARRLRPGRAARRGRAHGAVHRGARARPRLLHDLLARARRHRPGVLHRRLHRRAAGAGQARRRLLLLRRPVGPPVRDAQLHLAPRRRADDGARARPRRARRAGPPAAGSSSSAPR